MAFLDKYELTKVISMSNDILKSEYYTQPELELTIQQKKLLMFLISKISRDDKEFKAETIHLSDYCDLFGISYEGGYNKKAVRRSILSLGKKCFMLPLPDGTEELCRWVGKVNFDPKREVIKIKLAEELRPYYLGLNERFTAYQLGYTVNFRSKYSYILYEFFKSHEFKHCFYYDVETAKKELAYGKYKSFTDFKRYVLDPAVKEINEQTDINVKYQAVKEWKSYTNLYFCVEKKRGKALAKVDGWKPNGAQKVKNRETLRDFFHDELYTAVMDDGSKDAEYQAEYEDAIVANTSSRSSHK